MSSKGMPKPGEFCWNELLTSDTEKAKDFYTSVLGWKTKDQNIEGMDYTMFMAEDKGFGGMMQIPSEKKSQVSSHWISYIAVKGLPEILEKAKKHGASILKPVTTIPERGRFAIITDPTGAAIAFWETFL